MGTKIRNSAPLAKKPTAFAKKAPVFVRKQPTFLLPRRAQRSSLCILHGKHTRNEKNKCERHIKRHIVASQNAIWQLKNALYKRKRRQAIPQKTKAPNFHLSTTHRKAVTSHKERQNKTLKMSAFPIIICTFAESLRPSLSRRARHAAQRAGRFVRHRPHRIGARCAAFFTLALSAAFSFPLSCFLFAKESMHLYTLTSNQEDLWRKN